MKFFSPISRVVHDTGTSISGSYGVDADAGFIKVPLEYFRQHLMQPNDNLPMLHSANEK